MRLYGSSIWMPMLKSLTLLMLMVPCEVHVHGVTGGFDTWVWLKIKQEGQNAGFGPCFHLPGQPILVPVLRATATCQSAMSARLEPAAEQIFPGVAVSEPRLPRLCHRGVRRGPSDGRRVDRIGA